MEESDKHKPVSAVEGALGKEESSGYSRSVKLPVFGEIPLTITEIIADIKSRENTPLWAQFFKYVIFGLLGFGVYIGVYALVRVFYGGYIADELPSDVLKSHLTHVLILAFMVSNLVSYITNRIFVFTPSGRSKLAEFGIFLLVSSISFYAGNVAKNWFIDAGLHKDLAVLSFAIASVLVNFITRKYIVFSDKKFTEEGSVPVS